MRRLTFPTKTTTVRRPTPGLRAAFTLVEMMIVISIIITLMAMLLPALQAVFSTAKDAQVRTEIVGLANACDNFKGSHKHYPPSYVVLYEQAGAWTDESKQTIRKIWGLEFDFTKDRDINNDGDSTDVLTLKGAECLVFFLGGIPKKDTATGQFSLLGFSKSNVDPFKLGGNNRIRYFTEWQVGRLRDADGDGMPEYADEFNAGNPAGPYMYASTMRTGKYEPTNDINTNPPMTSVYLQSQTASGSVPWKDGAFQIISPGRDGRYGTGGLFTEDGGVGTRVDEFDNMTNFSRTRLER